MAIVSLSIQQKKQIYQIAKDFNTFIASMGDDYNLLSNYLGHSVTDIQEMLVLLYHFEANKEDKQCD
jgi:hypothetical protein